MPGTITTDLQTYDNADAATNWVTLGTWATAPVANADMNIQGTNALVGRVSANTAWYYASNTGLDLTTGNHIFIWLKNVTWPGTDTIANGGLRVVASSDATPTLTGTTPANGPSNSKNWYVDGTDTQTVAGWVCYVIDPNGVPDLTLGTPTMNSIKRIGLGAKVVATIGAGSFKPSNVLVDAVRYGTGLTVLSGTSAAPVAFADVFSTDSNTTNSYGVLTQAGGIFNLAGKLNIGQGSQTVATYFADTQKIIGYQNFPVSSGSVGNAGFYEIVVSGSVTHSSSFQLGTYSGGAASNGCSVFAAGVRSWSLTCVNSGSIANLYACTLSQLKAAKLNNSSSMRSCVVSSFGTITPNGATIDSCVFSNLTTGSSIQATYALIVNDPTQMASVTNCKFTNCNRAIKITAAGTYTFSNIVFSGNTFDVENSSSGLVTINVVSGGTTPSVTDTGGGSHVVNSNVSITLTGLQNPTEVRVYSAGTHTELVGNDNVTGGTFTFSVGSGVAVDISIISLLYQNERILGYSSTTDATVPIEQQIDRQYET